MYAQICTRSDNIHCWNVGQIFKQPRDGSLESNQTGYEVFIEK